MATRSSPSGRAAGGPQPTIAARAPGRVRITFHFPCVRSASIRMKSVQVERPVPEPIRSSIVKPIGLASELAPGEFGRDRQLLGIEHRADRQSDEARRPMGAAARPGSADPAIGPNPAGSRSGPSPPPRRGSVMAHIGMGISPRQPQRGQSPWPRRSRIMVASRMKSRAGGRHRGQGQTRRIRAAPTRSSTAEPISRQAPSDPLRG